jgi:membrane-bound serine protease (ClpP class)
MGNPTVIWAIVCFAVAFILFFLEIFVPSGGIIGFVAAASLIGGIVMLFRIDTTLGVIGIVVSVATLPFIIGFALHVWPNTPIGRMLMLNQRQAPMSDAHSEPRGVIEVDPLVGQMGKAVTDLRPVGTCVIEGKRMECLAASGMIRSGAAVKVVAVDGSQVKVREG